MWSRHRPNRIAPMSTEIPAIGTKTIRPSPNIVEVFRNAGYALPAAIADLVDNSIDAKAKNVLVRFVRTNSALQELLLTLIYEFHQNNHLLYL